MLVVKWIFDKYSSGVEYSNYKINICIDLAFGYLRDNTKVKLHQLVKAIIYRLKTAT